MVESVILSKLELASNKGQLLELIAEDILIDLKFLNVNRQRAGSQYGFDLVAYRNDEGQNECWKIECKNLINGAKVSDVAPKVVWHLGDGRIDTFVVISPNGISNDLRLLLETHPFSFEVQIWHGEYLEKLINDSPRALLRLEVPKQSFDRNAEPEKFPSSLFFFEAYHRYRMPYSIDFFEIEQSYFKSYTEDQFLIDVLIQNKSNSDLIINEIVIITVDYKRVESRVLRQFKMKGLKEPIKFSFEPSYYRGLEVELLSPDKVLVVGKGSTEILQFSLADKIKSGFYNLMFEVRGNSRGKAVRLNSEIFHLNVLDTDADQLSLCVLGKYYEEPVPAILELSNQKWNLLKDNPDGSLRFLGKTILPKSLDIEPMSWKILEVKVRRIDSHTGELDDSESVLLDLGTPITEELYSVAGFLSSHFDKD